jgi:hypothetical protein
LNFLSWVVVVAAVLVMAAVAVLEVLRRPPDSR